MLTPDIKIVSLYMKNFVGSFEGFPKKLCIEVSGAPLAAGVHKS